MREEIQRYEKAIDFFKTALKADRLSGFSKKPGPKDQAFYSATLDLDSLTASIMSFVVALVLIPGTSNGDLGDKVKVSSPRRFIITKDFEHFHR